MIQCWEEHFITMYHALEQLHIFAHVYPSLYTWGCSFIVYWNYFLLQLWSTVIFFPRAWLLHLKTIPFTIKSCVCLLKSKSHWVSLSRNQSHNKVNALPIARAHTIFTILLYVPAIPGHLAFWEFYAALSFKLYTLEFADSNIRFLYKNIVPFL